MKARAPAIPSSCEESRLIEAIVGAALWAEGGGKTGADEAYWRRYPGTLFPKTDVMAVRDLVALEGPYVMNEEGRADPLRIIEADGRERDISFDIEKNIKESKGGEMTVEVTGRVSEEDNRSALGSWMNGDFIKLCKCLVRGEGLIKIQNCEDGFCWLFSGVYGPSLMKEREDFWAELGAVRGLWSDPWCVAGDFNVVRFPVESSRGGRLSASMRRISEIMEDLELRDLPLQGGSFTWKGGLNNHPIQGLIDGGGVRSGPMPFRFENMWLKEEGFKEKMQGWDWNKLEFGKVEVNKALALSQVDFWDKMELSRTLSVQEGVVNEFKAMLSSARGWRPSIRGLSFERLEAVDAASLEEPFSEQEVMEALKEEVLGFFREFHNHGRFVKSLNATFIVLIPKKGGAEELRDFRPISLVGGLYKWLAKVLANRLKRVVGKVVSKAQNAFVQGRQILDAVLVANEVLDSVLKNKEEAVMCKLDIEKAYDHVEWSFLFSVMRKMGFGEKWIRWMKWCISTVSFSVLVNGSSSGFFQSSRGLRQGDPLSPYLFVLVMEAFSSLLRKAVAGALCLLVRQEVGVVRELMCHTFCLLMTLWFSVVLPSELIPVGCVNNVEELAAAIGCKVGSLPTSYLGLPLGAQYRSQAVWDGVEERMRKIWLDGRANTYPKETEVRADSEGVLMGGGAFERKIHLVKWELVCLEKDKGGLGVKSISILNKALLCKWSWRFAMEREAFWNKVIRGKYGEEQGGWSSKEARGETHGVGLWKTLRKEWEVVKSRLVFVDAWVKDVWRCNEGGGSWSPLFSRPFNDWELEEVCSFFVALNRKQIQQGVDDRVIWRETNCGKFSVKSLYKSLVSGHPISFPSSAIWKVTVQPRWVLLATVKETLLGWNGSFVGKKRKGVWKASHLCLFWTVWKTRNKVAFEEEELSIQRLKASFVYFLWSETKRSIKDGPSTLVDFVGWVASR
ncbi:Transposon TX1 uncharacterized 149 kDa protein [Vitis vinifera]|uniref:Transposon TX1 uncharacterized 149 kDa protein n=1 Tax=Vitis vinifera TaxID=29760 RepID=A0A438JUG0_VITVI|nr:Transposon TX1 uncharacterized 149 kDa protein [Vitis vinifera]